jgi:hypothetical protein
VVDYVDTRAYLAHVAQTVIDSGFVSVKAATRPRPATWIVATAALDRGHAPSARADRRAKDTIAWARDDLPRRERLSDFECRLVHVLGMDRLTRRELPTAAAAIYAFHQELRQRIAVRAKAGEHIGTPGQCVTAQLTVRRVERAATPHGPVYRHFLIDDLGRQAIWDAVEEQLPLDTQRVQATVGAHAEERGRPVTILADCAPAT